MHAFPNNKYRGGAEQDPTKARVEQELAIGKILETHEAQMIKFSILPSNGQEGDKTRYNFTINDQKAAIECFQEVSLNKNVCQDGRTTLRIFYVKPGK